MSSNIPMRNERKKSFFDKKVTLLFAVISLIGKR